MKDFLVAIFAGTLLVWLSACTLVVPGVMFASWLDARDCRLIHQQECHWEMVPTKGTDQ